MQGVEGLLLRTGPGPEVVLVSEENYWCDNIGIVGNEFVIEVHKP